ncbi:PREDICTED: midasin isoform X2 [Vollenhovia emeryi]|uniref:midasin isoform X2 n=1 Tax=Vollenhovia emeryi TaxID=411798 RepID=UPI0005F487AE|nr:PREDICTED: midasin isoform X2 [Vollenhovia emeryi]
MLTENVTIFCEREQKYKERLSPFLHEFNELQLDEILDILREFLMQIECTQDVADCFPELLPALVSLAIPVDDVQSSTLMDKNAIHRLNCVVLGKLVKVNQDLLVFVLRYFDKNPAPFEPLDDSHDTVPSRKRQRRSKCSSVSEVSEHDVVVACYNILQSATSHFKHKWNWSRFYKYLTNADDGVKWVALKCIAIVLNMSEATRLSYAQALIRSFARFLTDHEAKGADTGVTRGSFESVEDAIKNISSIVSVGGILLPTLGRSQSTRHLVAVSSTRKNLQSLAIAVGSRKCICLQGPVGCGKTALVEYLARVTGHDTSSFVKVQLGDQTDSKMLLGMYRCTDVPGEFVWQPGVLTQAVVAGKWLLLEDVDSAALDVASVLSHLMETGTLCVPGYRDTIYASSGFQLFVTQRLMMSTTGVQKHVTGASSLLQKHWLCLNVEPLSKEELVIVVQTLFPVLSTIATRIVDVFLLVSLGDHDGESNASDAMLSLKIGRQTSTRDLIKWCSRAIVDFDVSSSDSALKIFQDALDVFCCSVPNQEQRLQLATEVVHKLGIIKTKAEHFCNMHKPSVTLLPEFLIAGRAKLTRQKAQYARIDVERVNFFFTRPSACLLERIASCVMQKEPVLLVGETGTGKTSSVQYLARSTGHRLTIINMNQQSESADLLGGYKPVDLKFLISPIREEFEILFRSYFVLEPNRKFLENVALCNKQEKWKNLVTLMSYSTRAAVKRLKNKLGNPEDSAFKDASKHQKRDKNSRERSDRDDAQADTDLLRKWEKLLEKLEKLAAQVKSQYALAFSFIEGSLVRALRDGYWVLLDEINLANAETLECLSGLLEGSSESLPLLERGDGEPVTRHPDFTVFACMNPATDVGKRDLPVGLRNRFTEFYIDELTERSDLQLLVSNYLAELNLPLEKHEAIVMFYLKVRQEATAKLFDGTAHKPHYSLRTLCRALYISSSNPCGNILRSLYEAFSLSFLTQLDHNSHRIVHEMIERAILGNKNVVKAVLGTPIPKPRCSPGEEYMCIEGYWVLRGSLTPEAPSNYILTDSVRRNLKDLVRVVSIGKIPVLLQGDTSVGKTSLITYLAKTTGHVCVRINNHEHTDLQEYVGSYVADETGKLVFKEGVLVDAMRKGHWIILDELNLAPSDVLEALNRVLDDNRELFIPETQQVVKAHEHFMLFATQNPPGLYGGRKVLSRAFRNRFVELHFDEIPPKELQTILNQRCSMPESYCRQMIEVMMDLQRRRKSTATFAGKKGFVTLRDLFRWGERYRLAPDVGNRLYDWNQHLADEGYLVLAAKVRKAEEADEIRQVIKQHLRRDVDPDSLFTLDDKTSLVTKCILEEILRNDIPGFGHIVWTYHMRRMAVLVKKSCQFKEPVLLVGETGGGKTTVCQLIAAINGQAMRGVNCHMHTESSDFLGNLRPVREHAEDDQRLFEWMDGPLINAMRNGDLFLADEISLADDSVLERLNSLLEPERSLLLAEKGIESSHGEENTVIVADEKFVFVGTMNPGGDYGKKELSPALRNRFTEVWCEGCTARRDLRDIIIHNLLIDSRATRESVADAILRFTEWLPTTEVGKKLTVSIRDVLTWVDFINVSTVGTPLAKLTIEEAYYHGACLTYIDSLGSGTTGSESVGKLRDFTVTAFQFIKLEIKDTIKSELDTETSVINENVVVDTPDVFGVSPFYIKKGSYISCEDPAFTFTTSITKLNTLKLLRALQLNKPILLEGSPGVGKTSLVSALAKAAGHTLIRINLSDQTDVSDLFGADLPVENGKGGEFAWRDGPFLRALRAGYWILLDELNLASQSVLEGLNACFDHRGEIYIPELGKTFTVKPGTRLFGCQNPLRQGGARRGLPRSFLNRFTQVSVDALMEDDLRFILGAQFPQLPVELINAMVQFNSKLASEAGILWGHTGSPWEMNLRDITRWCQTTIEAASNEFRSNQQYFNPGDSVELIYINRMRTNEDRQRVYQIYQEKFSLEKYPLPSQLPMHVTVDQLFIGDVTLSRKNCSVPQDFNLLVLREQKKALKSLMQCVKMNWMSILIGASGCGKSSVVRLLAALTGQKLRSIAVNSAMDTTEILGGFEQTDYNRHLEQLFEHVATLLIESLQTKIAIDKLDQVAELHERLEQVRHLFDENVAGRTMAAETKLFLHKIEELSKLVSAMRLCEPARESELRDIESRLRNLSIFVEQDKCLNAGGKFEWVDSVLVKCLQDGTWLLIDQVNLCSPAVLDRLNGLLEPNGVLSIGERGVDDKGNVVTIKPHENFRLFLTMDPRCGEISRAMRNRGVEIYMLGPKENIDENVIDFKSLLLNAGITKSAHRDALLEIHGRVSEEIVAVDRFSAVDLVHAAFLMRQRSLRGFPAERSIRNACLDVYVRSRPSRDPRFREHLTSLIDETIERRVARRDDKEMSVIDLDAATWSVKNLQDNLRLTIIRQQGLLLNAAIKMHESFLKSDSGGDVTTKPLNDFCGLEEDERLDIDVADVLPYLLLNFYEQSTRDDAPLRREWISRLLRGNAMLGDLEERSALMTKVIALFCPEPANARSSLPWDLRRLVGGTTRDEDDGACRGANKLLLLLYACGMILKSDASRKKTETLESRDALSVKLYSSLVNDGKLLSQLKDQPLVTCFVQFLGQANSCISAILQDVNVTVEECVELKAELRWFARFERLGEMTLLIDKSKKSQVFANLEQISLLLRVHYKWLLKFLRKLFVIARNSLSAGTTSEIEQLWETVRRTNDQLKSVYDPIRKISKRIKKYLTLPPPHSTEISMEVHSRLTRVTRDLDVRDEGGSTLKRELKIISVQSEDALAMRRQTIALWSKAHSRKSTLDETMLQIVHEVERFCDESHIRLRVPAEVEATLNRMRSLPERETAQLNARIRLWPIYEYAFLSLAGTLQGEMCREATIPGVALTECLARFTDVPSIPSDLMGLLRAISQMEAEQGSELLLLPELFCHLAQFVQRSHAFRDTSRLLHWSGLTEEDEEMSMTSYTEPKMECYVGGPVLLNLVLRLMLDKAHQEKEKGVLSTIALGTYAAQMNQLELLNEILWRNSISLTNKRCDSSSSDLATLKFHLHLYSSTIDKMNLEHNVLDLIAIAREKQSGNVADVFEQRLISDYFTPVKELHEAYNEINVISEESVHGEESTLRRGRAWMILGYIQLMLFGNLDLIDPVHKVELKLKYLEEDIANCRRTIYVATLQDRILSTSAADERIHPIFATTRNCERRLLKTRDDLSGLKAFRPQSVSFASLSKDSANFRNGVGSYALVRERMSNLCAIASKISRDCKSTDLTIAENVSQKAEVWGLSVQQFAEQIKTKYLAAYPDVVLPLLTALAQLNHGVSMLINETRRLISLRRSGVADLESLIYNLIRFPTVGRQQENLLNLSSLCVSRSTRDLIGENSRSTDTFVKMQEQFQIFKSGLHELHNHVILNKGLTRSLWRDMNELLQQIVLIWKQQQQEEEKRAAERESLYKNKIENHGDALTEEEELALEVRKLFPTHRERDFRDIEEQPSFDRRSASPTQSVETESSFSGLVTKDDIREIQLIHSDIVSFIVTKWMCNSPASVSAANYVGPLIQRYGTTYGMLDNLLPSLSEGLAIELYTSLNFLVTLGLQASRDKGADRTLWENVVEGRVRAYDFYKDCNVEEAKQCLPLCERILIRVDQLLEEWPEHPTLRSIRCIIERIYAFPITSPISRFLTGLELLFVKMHQWKENAHSGVSMTDHELALTQQIKCWRRMELSCWKGCLDAAHENLRSDTSRWWFFLYALIESYITRPEKSNIGKEGDEPVTRLKLVESLERFMNESSLVEFESRLGLLLTFHCHVYYLDDSGNKNELLAILWNVHNYYKQFVDDVNARIAALKAPIEKKLKDFVKIERWNDINYWAVKETVEKMHRTLHKFIKEFQKALKQNVSSCLIVKSGSYSAELNKGIWDDGEHHRRVVNPEDFTIPKSSRPADVETPFTSGLIARTETLLTKARRLCKEIVLANSYPHVREELESFVEDYMEQSARLRDMNVDRSLPKNKQKSQAKSILQQKKMTLANYFKALTQMGVSYRAGILTLRNDAEKVTDFTVPPLDLCTINRYFKLSKPDQGMLAQWRSCERYYYKSLIKLNALNAMLSTSQTDLGLQNVERCRGFSAHLMLMAHRQKTTLVQAFDRFSSLRIQISRLSETGEQDLNILRQSRGRYCADSLKTLLMTLEVGFEQLLLFLQCCPAESSTDSNRAALTLDANALPIIAASQNDEVWKNANALLKDILNSVKAIAKRFHVLFLPFDILSVNHPERFTHTSPLSTKDFEFLEQCCATIRDLRVRSKELQRLFESPDVVHPIWKDIAFLDTKMEGFLNLSEKLRSSTDVENGEQLGEKNHAVEQYESALEHLINTILLVIQKKYKAQTNTGEDVPRLNEEPNEENDMEREAGEELNVRLTELLERDITELKLSDICNSLSNLLLSTRELDLQSANYCTRLLLKCLPLLEQYILLVQFYFNEQVASFRVTCKILYLQLNVFLDLAANGFCVPKDLDLEESDTNESGERTEKGGMGLADGEGTKDVSDRIESEDQLEDARPADQEQEKPDDKTCKEEEKGIDMSEDFDSKLQDMEKNDDDEEQSDDDEENDLDKEMGQTGEGAEQLDKEIWGDDQEESGEDNEQPENEDEEEGTGEQIGGKEMSARDDTDKRKQEDDNDDDENRQEESKKEINELNEPEVDEDQINPYHGKFQPPPEPEPLDLPEDMNLDEDGKEDNGGEEENPFDIDEMKKPPPEKQDVELEKESGEAKENDSEENSSEDENDNNNVDEETQARRAEEELEIDEKTEEKNGENATNKDEEQNRDEEAEEEKLQEKAAPSANDASEQMDAAQQIEETAEGSRDTVAHQPEDTKNQQSETSAENTQEDSNDKGTGQSQSVQQESGHSGSSKQETVPAPQSNAMTKPVEKRKNPGESNEDRSLFDRFEPTLKKLKTIYTQDEISRDEKENDASNVDGDKAEMAQHVKDSERFDDYTLDAATEDQVRQQASNADKAEDEEEKENDTMDVEMHEDKENDVANDKINEQKAERVSEIADNKCKKDPDGKSNNVDDNQTETTVALEGETAETMKVQRGNESTFHTMECSVEENDLGSGHVERKRFEVERMLGEWTQMPSTEEAAAAWNCLCSVTDAAARDLSEKLRLVLEPTQASRLKGDYKTGKRINMRKIIPYIASQFRKDKIWLRRTKPSKRDYQIVLALDDSSSMADNHSKELAFESLSLISKAMTYLEVGQLSVISFGEQVKVLHPLGEAFTEQSGSRLIQEMRFDQKKTMIGQLVDFTVEMFESQRASSDNAKLLVVLSDGRGIFSEGKDIVTCAVRRARLVDIFLVFIIVDNPINKDSILDIRMPVFQDRKLLSIRPYMDNFPFPFYMILRDINTLPGVLSDALRQWFEVVGKIDT